MRYIYLRRTEEQNHKKSAKGLLCTKSTMAEQGVQVLASCFLLTASSATVRAQFEPQGLRSDFVARAVEATAAAQLQSAT